MTDSTKTSRQAYEKLLQFEPEKLVDLAMYQDNTIEGLNETLRTWREAWQKVIDENLRLKESIKDPFSFDAMPNRIKQSLLEEGIKSLEECAVNPRRLKQTAGIGTKSFNEIKARAILKGLEWNE